MNPGLKGSLWNQKWCLKEPFLEGFLRHLYRFFVEPFGTLGSLCVGCHHSACSPFTWMGGSVLFVEVVQSTVERPAAADGERATPTGIFNSVYFM